MASRNRCDLKDRRRARRAARREGRHRSRHNRKARSSGLAKIFALLGLCAPLLLLGLLARSTFSGSGGESPPLTTSYSWTAGRLAEVSLPAGDSVRYDYDPRGNLVRRRHSDLSGALIRDTRFLIDENNPSGYTQILAEIDGQTGRVEKFNTWAPGGLLAQTTFAAGQAVKSYPMADGLGSIRAVDRIDSGGVRTTTQHDYSAFGAPLNAPPDGGYAFAGQWRDPATGLQFHRARWYDPRLGMFIGPDPNFDFPENQGHAYAYAGSDPVNKTDPTGETTLLEQLTVVSVQMQVALIQYGRYGPIVADVIIGFFSDDPYLPSITPAGRVASGTRALGGRAIKRWLQNQGWEIVAEQTRWNGAGVDVILKKPGWDIYRIAEIKVSVNNRFSSLLGQAEYGWQMSKKWIEKSLDILRIRKFNRNFSGMVSDLTPEQITFIEKNLGNADRVEKVLYGLNVLGTEGNSGMHVGRLYEMEVQFMDDVLGKGARPVLFKRAEHLMIFDEIGTVP